MKIYVGGFTSCTVHNEKYMLENVIKKTKNEFTYSITDADLIIYLDSCIGTYDSFLFNFKKLSEIFSNKKESAKVVISGCLSKGVKFELNDIQKLILSKCSIVLPENIVSWLENYLTNNKVINSEAFIPYTLDNGRLSVSLVNGCLNHCSFCKVAYANFDLKSYPL